MWSDFRGKKQPWDLCMWVCQQKLLLFCFLLILEGGPKLREKKMLPRISTFWIFPLQLSTSEEKQKVAPGSWLSFCFSAEVDSYKRKIRKVDIRGRVFLFFRFSEIRSTHNDEQKTKNKQFLMANLHAKVSGLSFASSSDNLKKTFWDFLENFKF